MNKKDWKTKAKKQAHKVAKKIKDKGHDVVVKFQGRSEK
jgi:ADP-heptose:LPS heptosyltransferase